jgi:hypothetical protein
MGQGQSQFEDGQIENHPFKPYVQDQTTRWRRDNDDNNDNVSQAYWEKPSQENYQSGYAEQASEPYYHGPARQEEKLVPRQKRKKKLAKPWIKLCIYSIIIIVAVSSILIRYKQVVNTSVTQAPLPIATTVYKVTSTPTLVIHDTQSQIEIHVGNAQSANLVTINANEAPAMTSKLDGNTINIADTSSYGDISITVPRRVDLQIVTGDGPVLVDGIDGKVNISTQTGPVTLNAQTLFTSSQVQTVAGSINLGAGFDPQGRYLFTTMSGNITAATAPGEPVHFIPTTLSGTIANKDHTISTIDGHQAAVQLQTVTGSIFIAIG